MHILCILLFVLLNPILKMKLTIHSFTRLSGILPPPTISSFSSKTGYMNIVLLLLSDSIDALSSIETACRKLQHVSVWRITTLSSFPVLYEKLSHSNKPTFFIGSTAMHSLSGQPCLSLLQKHPMTEARGEVQKYLTFVRFIILKDKELTAQEYLHPAVCLIADQTTTIIQYVQEHYDLIRSSLLLASTSEINSEDKDFFKGKSQNRQVEK